MHFKCIPSNHMNDTGIDLNDAIDDEPFFAKHVILPLSIKALSFNLCQ